MVLRDAGASLAAFPRWSMGTMSGKNNTVNAIIK